MYISMPTVARSRRCVAAAKAISGSAAGDDAGADQQGCGRQVVAGKDGG